MFAALVHDAAGLPPMAGLGYIPEAPGGKRVPSDSPDHGEGIATLTLLLRTRAGDPWARERLCERYLPLLRRWATGRLPVWARDLLDTNDLVQEALLRTLDRIGDLEVRGEGPFQAYLRRAILNRIQDEVRRARRGPPRTDLPDDMAGGGPSPLEAAVGREALERYEAALERLRAEDREAIVARVEMGLPYARVAEVLGKPSADAAQMAVGRALVRLAREMGHE